MPPARGSPANLVIRPQVRGQALGGSVIAAGGWLAASAAYLLKFHGFVLAILAIVDVLVLVGTIVLFRRSAQRTKLALVDGTLVFSSAFRDRVVFAASRPGRVIEIEVDWGWLSGRRSRLWLLTDADGRTEVNLNRPAWDRTELEDLRQRLGLPLEVVERPLRLTEARRAFPRTIAWWAVHPLLTTYGFIAVIVVAILGARLGS